ncbi:hypothetical protein [uncultured Microbacterium sp.]|uniref:hypothetical protein n=1 Tax=uncultured Microbacterium sp. TaxID=191216 RepID=UPI0025F744F7|nr:hypothetical protein [uncultured Microbacterium sp.]
MSSSAHGSEPVNPVPSVREAAQTRLLSLRILPRRGLAAGGGHVREIHAWTDASGRHAGSLQLVELRGPVGVLALAPDAVHVLAGIGGPQVEVGTNPAIGLRKERVLRCTGSHVELRRPRLRAAELSRIVVLSAAAEVPVPSLVFADLQGTAALPERTRAILVRSGRVTTGVLTGRAMDVLLLADGQTTVEAADARVLLLVG